LLILQTEDVASKYIRLQYILATEETNSKIKVKGKKTKVIKISPQSCTSNSVVYEKSLELTYVLTD